MKQAMKQLNYALVLTLAALLCLPAAQADDFEQPRQISVTGEGTAAIAPDMAILSLTVMRDAGTAREALSENSNAMAKIIAAMKSSGIASRDLQTSGLNIQPRYSYPQRNTPGEMRKLIGYEVRNSLTVRVRDLTKVGAILDQSVTLGVNEGGNIVFDNDDPGQALREARVSAVRDAREKAETLAMAAGVKLGEVVQISEQSYANRPTQLAVRGARMMAAEADSVPVEGGENSYRVNVHMTFAIED